VTYLASAGDFGHGLYDPATYQRVISVGGTLLSDAGGREGRQAQVLARPSGPIPRGCSSTDSPSRNGRRIPDCISPHGERHARRSRSTRPSTTGYDESGWITVDGTTSLHACRPAWSLPRQLHQNKWWRDALDTLEAEQKKVPLSGDDGSDGGSGRNVSQQCGTNSSESSAVPLVGERRTESARCDEIAILLPLHT